MVHLSKSRERIKELELRRADSSSAAYEQPNPPAKSEVRPMVTDSVQVQMGIDRENKNCIRFAAQGEAADEVCRSIFVQNQALEKLGDPEVIKVTIEAVSLEADAGS